MLPGLAAKIAGPASVLAWAGLLAVSGLFALVFTALGTRIPDGGGVIAYTAAGPGPPCRPRRGLVLPDGRGARRSGGLPDRRRLRHRADRRRTRRDPLAAALLLAAVTALTAAGARAGTAVQMVLVGLLLTVVVVAVAGAAALAGLANWTPFAPHGWTAIGSAASVLMLSFVGWEAAAPLTRRLADPARALPRITAIAFAVTTVVYLALAAAVVAVLGAGAAGTGAGGGPAAGRHRVCGAGCRRRRGGAADAGGGERLHDRSGRVVGAPSQRAAAAAVAVAVAADP